MTSETWLPSGGGQTGDVIRGFDWSRTPLGPIGLWPAPVRTIVQMMLLSPLPMATLWGAEGTLIYNDGYARICGPRHPDALGRCVLDVWPEARAFNSHVIETSMAGGSLSFRAQELELWRHGHPERVWMDLDYMPVLGEDGAPLGTLATVIDVTERILTEQSLRDKEARFRAFVNATNDMVYRMSPDWQELRELDGRGMLESVEKPNAAWINDFVIAEDRHLVREAIERALATRRSFEVETRVRQRDGSIGWVLSRAVPFFDAGGELYEWFGAASDITERKVAEIALAESEAQLRELNETLEERIRDRGLELERAYESLRQAQKMQALGQLTGGIAHDFNNVLQALVGSLSLISRRPGDVKRVEEFARSGLHAAQRGAKLTAQLLAFSRAQKMEVKPVAMAQVLSGLTDMIGKTLGPSIRLSFDVEDHDLQVMADETQLEMALLNLAVNARDAMPNGGTLKLTAALKRVDGDADLQSGQYLEIAVADTGTGMSADVAARAFEPFFTTKGIGKGTGLGLSQVFGMAKQAGGTVRIESVPGRGTTVRLLLKLAEEKAEVSAGMVPQDIAAAGVSRVLVIDDDPDVRNFLASALQALGYESEVAEDGPSGLQRFQEYSPEVVIIDYLMPIMSGAEVAQVLRARKPELPIIFASGYSETRAIEEAVADDAIILRKPFTLDQLSLTINKVVQRGGSSSLASNESFQPPASSDATNNLLPTVKP